MSVAFQCWSNEYSKTCRPGSGSPYNTDIDQDCYCCSYNALDSMLTRKCTPECVITEIRKCLLAVGLHYVQLQWPNE